MRVREHRAQAMQQLRRQWADAPGAWTRRALRVCLLRGERGVRRRVSCRGLQATNSHGQRDNLLLLTLALTRPLHAAPFWAGLPLFFVVFLFVSFLSLFLHHRTTSHSSSSPASFLIRSIPRPGHSPCRTATKLFPPETQRSPHTIPPSLQHKPQWILPGHIAVFRAHLTNTNTALASNCSSAIPSFSGTRKSRHIGKKQLEILVRTQQGRVAE